MLAIAIGYLCNSVSLLPSLELQLQLSALPSSTSHRRFIDIELVWTR